MASNKELNLDYFAHPPDPPLIVTLSPTDPKVKQYFSFPTLDKPSEKRLSRQHRRRSNTRHVRAIPGSLAAGWCAGVHGAHAGHGGQGYVW